MTFYFYTSNAPTKLQISKVEEIFRYFDTGVKISYEATYADEIRINIIPFQEIFLIDVLMRIQLRLKDIFDTCSLFVK